MPTFAGPPFDRELDAVLTALAANVPPTITPAMIERFRAIAPDPTEKNVPTTAVLPCRIVV